MNQIETSSLEKSALFALEEECLAQQVAVPVAGADSQSAQSAAMAETPEGCRLCQMAPL